MDIPTLLSVFLHLQINDIFHFICVNKKCFDVSQTCLINPCHPTKKLLLLLERIQTIDTTYSTLKQLYQINTLEQIQTFQQQSIVLRLLIEDNDKRIFYPLSHIRKLSIITPTFNNFDNFHQMSQLQELKIPSHLLPSITQSIPFFPLTKVVLLSYETGIHQYFQCLIDHPHQPLVIIHSFQIQDINFLRSSYPFFIYVFDSFLLPVTEDIQSNVEQNKVFLYGNVQMNANLVNTTFCNVITNRYLPSFRLIDCNEDSSIPITHSLTIDTFFPSSIQFTTSLRSLQFFEKIGYCPNNYNLSNLCQLTRLVVVSNYSRPRKVVIPSCLSILESIQFVTHIKDFICERNKGLDALHLTKLVMTDATITSLPTIVSSISLTGCNVNKKINATKIKNLRLVNCNMKTITISSVCTELILEQCTDLKDIIMKK